MSARIPPRPGGGRPAERGFHGLRSRLDGAALIALIVIGCALSGALPADAAESAGVAVEGSDGVRLLPPAGAVVEDYRNAGYRLWLEEGEARIEVRTSPLYSRARFEMPPRVEGAEDGSVERLARGLSTGAETQYEAVSRILGWTARHIEYRLDRELPQGAEDVLARRSGYCTGIARLAVALLTAVGLEAREVAGYVLGDEAFGQPHGYHRWVEVRFPDVGWVFSDPLYSHHYVPATYLRLASDRLHLDRGTRGLLLERHDAVAPVDLYPLAAAGIRARRNSDLRLAASLRVAVEHRGEGLAVLESASRRWRHALVAGQTTFVGLEPGDYRLQVMVAGRTLRRELVVEGRQRRTLFLDAATPVPPVPGRTSILRSGVAPPEPVRRAPAKPGKNRDLGRVR